MFAKTSPFYFTSYTEIEQYFKHTVIVAHNASFDISVLRHTLSHFGIPFPEFDYFCTLKISQRIFPDCINYKLPTIAKKLDIIFKHHDALEDALASAHILIHSLKENNLHDIYNLSNRLDIRLGTVNKDGYTPCSVHNKLKDNFTKLIPNTDAFDEDNIFFGKTVVFTGTLLSMPRSVAAQKIVDCGGKVGNGITQDTNYLIVGEQDYSKFADGKMSSKMKKAFELSSKGTGIQLISEKDFLENIVISNESTSSFT